MIDDFYFRRFRDWVEKASSKVDEKWCTLEGKNCVQNLVDSLEETYDILENHFGTN
jgi:hypothetical protein